MKKGASGLAGLSALVYSTDAGRMCPDCRQPIGQCVCTSQRALPQGDGTVRVSRETKGRKGKGVTLVKGLLLGDDGLAQLSRELKAACGVGGTVKDGVIELQGDHVDTVIERLKRAGHTVRRAGG